MFAVLSPIRKATRPLAAMAMVALLAACEPISLPQLGNANSGPRVDPNAAVKVALLIPRTGPGDAPVAQALENGVRLALAEAGASRIELMVLDTAGSAEQAQLQAQAAADAGAQIVLGPLRADAVNAAGVAVGDDGLNVLGFSNNPSIAGGNVFILGQTFNTTAARLMSFARTRGKDSVAMVHSDDVPGQFAKIAVEQAATSNGMRIVSAEAYELSIEGVNAAAKRAGAAAGVADTVVVTSPASNAATPMLLQVLPDNGLAPGTVQYVGLTQWDVRPDLFSLPGANGAWFTVPDPTKRQSFEQRYLAAFGTAAHPLASVGYDGAAAVAALLAEGRSDALTSGALTRGKGFEGAVGAFRLNTNGTNSRALAIAQVNNQQVTIIDPAPSSLGSAGF